MQSNNIVKEQLKQVSEFLNLSYYSQDWGIINSDPERVFEFIKYLEDYPHSDELRYWLTELIIASINDGIDQKYYSKDQLSSLEEYIKNSKKVNPLVLAYWTSLREAPNVEEFPVSFWLKSILTDSLL
jgi:hypothetical protein